MDELRKLVPTKVDRYDHSGFVIKNLASNSFGLSPSNKNWDNRRKLATKTIGINFASKYIPTMIQTVDEWSENIKIGEKIDLTVELNRITFRIITKILFGKDIHKMEQWEYVSPKDKSISLLDFEDAYFKYANDEFSSNFSIPGRIAPFLKTLKLTEPFKSNFRNHQAIYSALSRFLDMSEDSQSVYKQLLNTGEISKEEVFNDTLLLLFAGFDTTSHGICSTLYYLHKNPQILNKLKGALDKDGISSIDVKQKDSLKELYEQCDYLNYWV